MDTKRVRQRDHNQELRRIDAAAVAASWEERLSAIETVQGLFRDLPTERTVEHLVEVLDRLASDRKWEVRKAVVPALVETDHPAARNVVERLTEDGNQWVRQAAERARRKLSRVTTPAEKRDKRTQYAFDLVKDLRGKSPERIYEVALQIGAQHYEELAGDTAHELNTYRALMEELLGELERQIGACHDPGDQTQGIINAADGALARENAPRSESQRLEQEGGKKDPHGYPRHNNFLDRERDGVTDGA